MNLLTLIVILLLLLLLLNVGVVIWYFQTRSKESQVLNQTFWGINQDMNKRLDTSAHVIGQLQKELGKMGHIATKIEHLDKLFRSPKARGTMGEENLEAMIGDIFPPSMYERQYRLGEGVVDMVIKTKNGLIPIDAKFPLPSFEAIIQSDDAIERAVAYKRFYSDLKKRVDEVAKYIQPQKGTLQFAILFLPSESIYYEGAIRTDEVQNYAREKQVLLSGPSTLIYILQMIFRAYQSQTFAEKAQEALAQLSGIQKEGQKLEEHLDILEKHLTHAHQKMSEVKRQSGKLQLSVDKVAMLREGEG